jgi:cysteine-rich repeat protein
MAACDGGSPLPNASNAPEETEINLVISDPATAAEQLALLIDSVTYRISCPSSGQTTYDDSVGISGHFEAHVDEDPGVWTLVSDLPPSQCTIALWVFYEDEVVCSGSQALLIVENGDPSTTNKVNIALECSLSVIPPSGDLDIDGTFNLIHGNYCPQLFWLGAVPTFADPTVMNVETSYIDLDNGCGENCDPRTCDFSVNPPVCTPAADPGLSSTLSAPAGNGGFGNANALTTTYACDPLLPGPTEICVLVTDGDVDCDRMRCITVDCPDLCEGVVCDDVDQNNNPNECTRDRCDRLDGSCSNDPALDGVACNNCGSTCQSGACTGAPFTADVEFNGTATLSGTQQQYNTTLVNPYSGASVPVSGQFRVNDLSYNGIGTADILSGLMPGGIQSEVLLIQDLIHPQTVCGVETIESLNGIDVMFLADDFILLQNMVIEGGTANDILWANAGDDTVRGNAGNDLLDGGPGDDVIEGGVGDDTITLWPGSGFDSIDGGLSVIDRVEIDAIQSQILISSAANPSYEFDIFYLGIPMAQIREVELLVMNDTFIDLATCTGSDPDICNLCGNDALNGGEGCDDGNNVNGDGCAANCTAEY